MKVYLAGFNVDTTVLSELQEKAGKRDDVTPEVISAAYARISRDPRLINEIRRDSRCEVEQARKSNRTIIFKMGHHSVAEHAVFNLDILGVSRLAMEEVEKFRLCSYTEKSQRYITLKGGFVIPQEIRNTPLEALFTDMVRQQNETYSVLFEKLKTHVFKKHPNLAKDPKKHNLLEGWAKEDARYVTSLATQAQVGQTINARNLELALRRFASHPLAEVRDLGKAIYEQIKDIAPSIVIFHHANDFDEKTYPQLQELVFEFIGKIPESDLKEVSPEVRLVEFTPDADTIVAASLIHTSTNLSYDECRSIVKNLPKQDLNRIFKTAWQNMQFYDSTLREFEYVNFTFNVILSAACFGQLKRHRMTTITAQSYDPQLGITVPDSIKEIGMESNFREMIDRTNQVYNAINNQIPLAAPYILTNAHRRRVLIRLNARELYHVSRLREDVQAQWDIRNITHQMSKLAREAMPLVLAMVGGKDKYNEIYKSIFGKLPKVTEAVLPGLRRIK